MVEESEIQSEAGSIFFKKKQDLAGRAQRRSQESSWIFWTVVVILVVVIGYGLLRYGMWYTFRPSFNPFNLGHGLRCNDI